MGTRTGLSIAALCLTACASAPPEPCTLVTSSTWVVARWDHERADGELAPGINLDRRVDEGGLGCEEAVDFVSPYTGERGVDDQYGVTLLPLLEELVPYTEGGASAVVAAQLASGDALVGIEIVRDADGTLHGALVDLGATGPVRLETRGDTLAPGQTFTELRRDEAVVSCTRERLELRVPSFGLPMGAPLGRRPVHDVIVRLDVAPDGSLRDGELGGAVLLEVVRQVMIDAAGDPRFDESIARSLARPDLERDASGTCGSCSLGVALTLAEAVIE